MLASWNGSPTRTSRASGRTASSSRDSSGSDTIDVSSMTTRSCGSGSSRSWRNAVRDRRTQQPVDGRRLDGPERRRPVGVDLPGVEQGRHLCLDGLLHPGRRLAGRRGQRRPDHRPPGLRHTRAPRPRMRATVCVLPVPGPPAMTVTGRVSARRAATNWRSTDPSSSSGMPPNTAARAASTVASSTDRPGERARHAAAPTAAATSTSNARTVAGRGGTRRARAGGGPRRHPVAHHRRDRHDGGRRQLGPPGLGLGQRHVTGRPLVVAGPPPPDRRTGARSRHTWPSRVARAASARASRQSSAGRTAARRSTARTSWTSKSPTTSASTHGAAPRRPPSVAQPVGTGRGRHRPTPAAARRAARSASSSSPSGQAPGNTPWGAPAPAAPGGPVIPRTNR